MGNAWTMGIVAPVCTASPYAWGVVIASSAVAVVTDLRSGRIPNLLTAPLMAGGMLVSLISGGPAGLLYALLGMILVAGPFIALWLLGGGGAGDAKMMAGVGVWLGVEWGITALLAVAMAGGVLSLVSSLRHGRLSLTLMNLMGFGLGLFALARGRRLSAEKQTWVPQPDSHRVHYALAICAGVCAAAVWGVLWTR